MVIIYIVVFIIVSFVFFNYLNLQLQGGLLGS